MKNIKKFYIYQITNSLSIIMIFVSAFIMLNSKLTSIRLSEEISYVKLKLSEQENDLKIINAQLSIITQSQSLLALYKSYHNLDKILLLNKINQVKTIDNVANYFRNSKRYSKLH